MGRIRGDVRKKEVEARAAAATVAAASSSIVGFIVAAIAPRNGIGDGVVGDVGQFKRHPVEELQKKVANTRLEHISFFGMPMVQ